MTDRKRLVDPTETPEDVATLYSWANLHGAKYRDFSASRAQTREKARQRVQEAIEAERRRARDEADALKNAEANKAAEAAILVEAQRKQEEAAREQELKAEQAAAQQRAWQATRPAEVPNAHPVHGPVQAPGHAPTQSQPYSGVSDQPGYAQPPGHAPGQHSYPPAVGQPLYTPPAPQAPSSQPVPLREEQYRGREDHFLQVRQPWTAAEVREPVARPAWLTERADVPV